jgi:tetratricopeptide (TPR) repeat protein
MGFFKRFFSVTHTPSQEQHVEQMEELNRRFVDWLQAALFKHCVEFVIVRYPGRRPDPIGAHMKLTCTGEGPNETSLANSTPEERSLGESLAAEAMQADATGFYWIPAQHFLDHIRSLPPTLESIKSLALTLDRQLALLLMARATDNSPGMNFPIIDRDSILAFALPLLLNADRYDAANAVLQSSISQMYFTLGDTERATAAALRASKLDPNFGEGWRLVGNSFMEAGDDAQARICFERALTLDPSLFGAREALKYLRP